MVFAIAGSHAHAARLCEKGSVPVGWEEGWPVATGTKTHCVIGPCGCVWLRQPAGFGCVAFPVTFGSSCNLQPCRIL